MGYAQVIIAEKPDLGRAVIEGLEKKKGVTPLKKDGYSVVADTAVTWAFGHLLKMYDPEDYDPELRAWNLDKLPMVFYKDLKYKADPDKEKQLKIIGGLINESTTVVNCGDPDEEGQRLIDEILEYHGNTKPVLRLLINDNNIQSVVKALDQMEPNENFKGLSRRALARAIADQHYGFNLTRGYTQKGQREGYQGVLSVGRVQTPVLGLVVNRDRAHEGHQKQTFYDMAGKFQIPGSEILTRFIAPDDFPKDDKKRLTSEDSLKTVKAACENKQGQIKTVETKSKTEAVPLPYNLLMLQADANRLFGYTADSVLKTTQDLREKHRLITYNRSDCRYLKEESFSDAPDVLAAIATTAPHLSEAARASNTSLKGPAFNSANVTAHTAIVPTGAKVQWDKLSEKEQKVYDLIARRYVLQFYPAREFDETKVIIDCEGYSFGTGSRTTTNKGWRVVFEEVKPETKAPAQKGRKKSDSQDGDEGGSSDTSDDLSQLTEGHQALCLACKIEKKATTPPPYFTEDTLLKALSRIADTVEDPEIKKLLKDRDAGKKDEHGSIGTPATRSAIFELLKKRNFLEQQGKFIKSTEAGRKFVDALPKSATVPDLTALWHEQQKEIEQGTKTIEDFLNGIMEHIGREIANLKTATLNMDADAPKCPVCGVGVIRSRKSGVGAVFFSCSNYPECKASFPADKKGKLIMEPCPACKKGFLRNVDGKNGKFFSCNNYPACKTSFSMLPKDGRPDLTPPDKKPKPEVSDKHKCTVCGSPLARRESKKKPGSFFWGCTKYTPNDSDNTCKAIYYDKDGAPDYESFKGE